MKLVDLLPYALWLAAGVLSLVLSHRSQVDAWAEKNPRLAGAMKLLRSLGLDPWMLLQSLSLIVNGKLPVKLQAAKIVAAADAPPPSAEVKAEVAKQSVAPPKLPPMFPGAMLGLFLAVTLCLPFTTSCSTSKPPAAPERPECKPEAAAEIAAACFLRVKTECVDKGIAKEDCAARAECRAQADKRLEECRK